ncbi:DUF1758 domain-containing protein [Trichonephila clavipes]|nr:DUF1758 domain-containing protein [Trichonephila clavipes]
MLIYTSIIRSVLLYACPVWGHAARGNINILEQSQNVIIRQITNSPWFVRNADLRFALRLKTIKATIKKIAEKFFNNLESIDNRTLRKIEIYTPDPQFNRPRNILLPDHTPIELLPPHWTGPSHPKIFKYGRSVGPTSPGTSSGEERFAATSPYRPGFSSPAADLRTLLAKAEDNATSLVSLCSGKENKRIRFGLQTLSALVNTNPKRSVQLRCMLDGDANKSFIQREVVELLDLKVVGKEDEVNCKDIVANHVIVRNEEFNFNRVRNLWSLETIGINLDNEVPLSDKQILKLFEQNTVYTNKRYETRLLWKEDSRELKSNYEIAKRHLFGLSKTFEKNEELYLKYDGIIKEHLKYSIIERVNMNLDKNINTGYFLPHHAVVREQKYSTKVRIVFDASSKGKGGVS